MVSADAHTRVISRNRRPNKHKRAVDPITAEREDHKHCVLEQLIFELCQEQGVACLTNRHIDLLARFGHTSILFEVKSGTKRRVEMETRLAVTQLLEYRYLYREIVGSDVRLCVVAGERLPPQYTWIIGYLTDLRIGLIWKNNENDCLNCSDFTKPLMGDFLPPIKGPDFYPSRLVIR